MNRRLALVLAGWLVVACSAAVPSGSPMRTPEPSASPSAKATLSPAPSPSPTATTEPSLPPVTPAPTPAVTPSPTPSGPTIAQLIGQKLMVAMAGTTPTADLLGRVRRGEVGGVILFGANIDSASQVRALTARLQKAARDGGQPPLLISTDQEGGSVKRIAWAPPTMSPPQMGASGTQGASTAKSQGLQTGQALLGLGINNDLAPVADVPSSTSSFMYQQGRTWSFDSAVTADLSSAFAIGLENGRVVPSMKHFPGIGRASLNTDNYAVTIKSSRATLDSGLEPYRQAIAQHIPLIMLSNATYTAWDAANAAGWSPAIATTLLRDELGFNGCTITDSLNGTAASRGVSTRSLAIKAALAGADIILITGSEANSTGVFNALVQAAQTGSIPLGTLRTSYERILTLKRNWL